MEGQSNKLENQSAGQRHAGCRAGHMSSVLTEDTVVGGHCVGVWVRLYVYYREQNSTGDKPQALSSSSHSDSVHSDHIPADYQLLDISVSVFNIIFMQMSVSGRVCILWKCIILLLTLLSFDRIPLQPQITCITPLSVICWSFLWNVLLRCPGSFSVLGIIPKADAGCFLCLSLDRRGLKLREYLGNISAPQSRDH